MPSDAVGDATAIRPMLDDDTGSWWQVPLGSKRHAELLRTGMGCVVWVIDTESDPDLGDVEHPVDHKVFDSEADALEWMGDEFDTVFYMEGA